MREYLVNSYDGTELVVWAAAATGSKPLVFYFHGNAGNLASRTGRFRRFLDRGYGVVAMAYRGSSGSAGQPSEAHISQDVLYLHDNLPLAHSGALIYYGESLGTGVAIQLAHARRPDALILEAPYQSVVKLAADAWPIFPVAQVLDQRWESIDYISQIDMPLLVIHGKRDQVIPIEHGRAIFQAAKSVDKQLFVQPDRNHHNLWSVQGQTQIYSFIDKIEK
ncbi:alpha/beta hydrolase [Amylibacter marinus]|uniref:alpha/beta hydrolase n=1 Tax=Amylibacter marinus TaxID=1475483 RepID=UPI0024E0F918|nr:alpha/beta hydrolase [Amylibacter marinus]